MSHLTLEALARLVDETPTDLESAHLAECEACRIELDTLREDVRALALLPDMTPAPDAWDDLAARLRAEGVVRAGRVRSFRFRPLLQAAAATVLFTGGLAVGRGLGSAASAGAAHAPAEPEPSHSEGVQPSSLATSRGRGPAVPATVPFAAEAAPDLENVARASTGGPVRDAPAHTVDEAVALLRETEAQYLGALTRYAELATDTELGDPVARLAALQSIVLTTQAALSQTPTDPIINGYHLTALAQRNATLRQVAAATSDRWY